MIGLFCIIVTTDSLQGLYGWRDGVAREEDESTGYILPNKTLLEIGTLDSATC